MVAKDPNQIASAEPSPLSTPSASQSDTDGDGHNGRRPSPSEALAELASLARQVKEFACTLLIAKADAIKATLRRILVLTALGIVAFVAASALIIVAVTLLLLGAARGIGSALGGQPWIGELIIGGSLVALLILAIFLTPKWLAASSRERTIAKYDQRQTRQRQRFGRDFTQAASARQTH